eukprot:1160852-Pelagomonas_calceolata.AAC.5
MAVSQAATVVMVMDMRIPCKQGCACLEQYEIQQHNDIALVTTVATFVPCLKFKPGTSSSESLHMS